MVLHLSFAMLLAKEAAVLFFLYYQNFAGTFVPMGNGRGQLNAYFLDPIVHFLSFLGPSPPLKILDSSGCLSTYSTVLLWVLSSIVVASVTTSMHF